MYELYAIRYAHRDASVRGEHFYGHDPCAEAPYPIDYYVWAAVSPAHVVLVDAGFTAETAERRGNRHYLRSPVDTLAALGVDAARVGHLVLTHLHYDHTGHVRDFPAATIVLQRSELAFWTGPHAHRGAHPHLASPDDLSYLVRENFTGRVTQPDGDRELVPGISVHHVGGHTPGLQVVRVRTAAGDAVVASDASHFYENIEGDRPYGIVNHLPAMYDAFDRINTLAGSPELIVAGHDPLVLDRYPAVPGLEGYAVRIA
ncbi:N-acyl homoserine lactonase family protein [Nonomuraea sp. NPDC050404]|uniref:N-acyl homoserine lactonase family protein n=1 Tax=Nonomuraea sp. NPDC050404 TaxID=3155783 RepID=UPI0033D31332